MLINTTSWLAAWWRCTTKHKCVGVGWLLLLQGLRDVIGWLCFHATEEHNPKRWKKRNKNPSYNDQFVLSWLNVHPHHRLIPPYFLCSSTFLSWLEKQFIFNFKTFLFLLFSSKSPIHPPTTAGHVSQETASMLCNNFWNVSTSKGTLTNTVRLLREPFVVVLGFFWSACSFFKSTHTSR